MVFPPQKSLSGLHVAVLHVFHRADLPSGEDEVVSYQVAALRRAGARVTLVESDSHRLDEHTVHGSSSLLASVVLGSEHSGLARQIRNLKVDVLHIHNLFPVWGDNWLKKLGVPTIVTLHNFRYTCVMAGLFRDGQKCHRCLGKSGVVGIIHRCYKGSVVRSLIIALGNLRRRMIRVYSAPRLHFVALSGRARDLHSVALPAMSSISTIPNFLPDDPPRDKESTPRNGWVFAGRIEPGKGIDQLIAAWPEGEKLKVLGGGELGGRFPRKRLNSSVEYLGMLSAGEVEKVLANAEGLIFPSIYHENAPMIYLRALKVGTPTVALRGNSVADDVAQRGTGVVFDSFEDISKALFEARNLPSPEAICRRVFTEQYTEPRWISSISGLYRDLGVTPKRGRIQ